MIVADVISVEKHWKKLLKNLIEQNMTKEVLWVFQQIMLIAKNMVQKFSQHQYKKLQKENKKQKTRLKFSLVFLLQKF